MRLFQKYIALFFCATCVVYTVNHLREEAVVRTIRASVKTEKEPNRVYWSNVTKGQFKEEWASRSRGQAKQDKYMYEHVFWKKTEPGVFVEFGGLDGLYTSNSYFFEQVLGWKGILIEADKNFFEKLKENRPNATTIHGAVCAEKGELEFLVANIPGWSGAADTYTEERLNAIKERVKVKCYTLNDVLEQYGYYHVDYMTVDTEGSEYEALKNVDFKKFKIDYLQVEALSYDTAKKEKIKKFLATKGYRLITDYFISDDTDDMIFERL